MISKFLYYRPRLEAALSQLDKNRLKLPLLSLQKLFPEFNDRRVSFDEVPVGPWSTPIADVTMLLKLAACSRPSRVMEVGSYRGHTALMLAKHLDADARIVTVDVDARHGDAFRDTSYATRIERRVTRVQSDAFLNDTPRSYDLIFLDADHAYAAVERDTAILLDLLSERGHFVWHDYGNWGKFSGKNGVPEFLHALSGQRPVAQIAGTWLAVHSPAWSSGDGAIKFRNALIEDDNVPHRDPWASEVTRG